MSQRNEEIRSLQSRTQLILRHLNLNQDHVLPVPPTNDVDDGYDGEQHNNGKIADDDDDDDLLIVFFCKVRI